MYIYIKNVNNIVTFIFNVTIIQVLHCTTIIIIIIIFIIMIIHHNTIYDNCQTNPTKNEEKSPFFSQFLTFRLFGYISVSLCSLSVEEKKEKIKIRRK